MSEPHRRQLGVILSIKSEERLPYSSHLVSDKDSAKIGRSQGWITSLAYSPILGHDVALALLENGHDRIGEQLVASAPIADQQVGVQVVSPHFFDPEGKRQYA